MKLVFSSLTLYLKVLYMHNTDQNLQAIHDIRKMMERSSRFISLSGWSGIAAGISALIGVWVVNGQLSDYYLHKYDTGGACGECLRTKVIMVAAIVFTVAFISAILFTYLKSRKEGVAIWDNTARRLLWNTLLPMIVGGMMVLKMIDIKEYGLITPAALLFYGLALINGSKYTMGEVRYLGYGQLIVGALALLDMQHHLLYFALGFGILHIIYGIAMWWKHDRA